MIHIRKATSDDVDDIKEVFTACYGNSYAYPEYYDTEQLKRTIYSDNNLFLVAEDSTNSRVVGTGSVILDIGAHSDLVGEFGRLAVHPDAQNRGIGKMIMERRLKEMENKLHVAIVENRASHTYSQRISQRYGFVPVGFLPGKLRFEKRESAALYAQYFGDSLRLRSNNPRVIPEVFELAQLSLENLNIGCDVVVQERVTPYPQSSQFEYKTLDTLAYPAVLRLERGRVNQREIFGPVRLHYGLFKIAATNCHYLIAHNNGRISGAIGYMIDPVERFARIFEQVSVGETPICDLLRECIRICREDNSTDYIEVDVSANAKRMQRTLSELGFIPTAYLPAFVFHEVERIDVVKMSLVIDTSGLDDASVVDRCRPIANRVLECVRQSQVAPQVLELVKKSELCSGLDREQCDRVAWMCELCDYRAEEVVFKQGTPSDRIYMLIEGGVKIIDGQTDQPACIGPGELLGEVAMLDQAEHSANAITRIESTIASIENIALERLALRRPDIGVVIYRNIARGLSHKLTRTTGQLRGE